MSNSVYATVEQYVLSTGAETTAKDDRIYRALQSATHQINIITGRHYPSKTKMFPIVATKFFDALPKYRSTEGILVSDRRAYGLTGQVYADFDITIDNRGYLNVFDMYGYEFINTPIITIGGTVVDSSDYFLYPPSELSKNKIIFKSSIFSNLSIYSYSDYRSSIEIEATWLKRLDGTDGWNPYPCFLNEDIDDTVTSFQVTPSLNGHTFSAGDLFRIEDELMNVYKVQGNVVYVYQRGDNGTTAASHLRNTEIDHYYTDISLQDAAITLAVLHTKQPGGTTFIPQTGMIFKEDAEYHSRVKHLTMPYKLMEY